MRWRLVEAVFAKSFDVFLALCIAGVVVLALCIWPLAAPDEAKAWLAEVGKQAGKSAGKLQRRYPHILPNLAGFAVPFVLGALAMLLALHSCGGETRAGVDPAVADSIESLRRENARLAAELADSRMRETLREAELASTRQLSNRALASYDEARAEVDVRDMPPVVRELVGAADSMRAAFARERADTDSLLAAKDSTISILQRRFAVVQEEARLQAGVIVSLEARLHDSRPATVPWKCALTGAAWGGASVVTRDPWVMGIGAVGTLLVCARDGGVL